MTGVALALVLALAAARQSDPPGSPQGRVAALAGGLESPDLSKVYHAVNDLAALGEPALGAIEARKAAATGRTRDYLELVAQEIRTARILTDLGPVHRISMKSSDRNVVELLGELRARTGIVLSLENLMGDDKLPEIPVDIQDATMMEAFDAISKAGNVTIAMENGHFKLYPDSYTELPRFFYDQYLFRLDNFSLTKTVEFRRPALQTFRIQMEVLWNPTAAPFQWGSPAVIEALDDHGKSLVPPPRPSAAASDGKPDGGAAEAPDDGETPSMFSLALLTPSPGSQKLAILRGTVAIGLPKTRSTVAFTSSPASAAGRSPGSAPPPAKAVDSPGDRFLEGQSQSSGDFTVRITKIEATPESGQYWISCEVSSSKIKPAILSAMPFIPNVVLKGGEPTRSFVIPTAGRDNVSELRIYYQRLRLKEPLVEERQVPPPPIERIELSIVTSIQERKIPFEFRDLKLR